MMIPFVVLTIMETVAYSVMMSSIFNKGASSISVAMIAAAVLYVMTYQWGVFNGFPQFNPLSYINIPNFLSVAVSAQFSASSVNMLNGMITSVAATLIFAFAAVRIFHKKDIIC
jgi:hypothetical protein